MMRTRRNGAVDEWTFSSFAELSKVRGFRYRLPWRRLQIADELLFARNARRDDRLAVGRICLRIALAATNAFFCPHVETVYEFPYAWKRNARRLIGRCTKTLNIWKSVEVGFGECVMMNSMYSIHLGENDENPGMGELFIRI